MRKNLFSYLLILVMLDCFSVKLSAQYSIEYQDIIGEPYDNFIEFYYIAADDQDNLIGRGFLSGTSTLGPFTLNENQGNVVIAKMDINKNWLWVIQCSGDHTVNGFRADGAGNVYLTGNFKGVLTIGNSTITSTFTTSGKGANKTTVYSQDLFTAKLSPTGVVLWIKAEGSTKGWDVGYGVASDASGNVYSTGYQTRLIAKSGGTSYAISDIYLVKYNSSGVKQWEKFYSNGATKMAQTCGSGTELQGRDVQVDDNGNVYFTGNFCKTVNFGGGHSVTASASSIFTTNVSSSGTTLWVQAGTGTGTSTNARYLTLDNTGDIYITGHYPNTGISFGNINLGLTGGAVNTYITKYSNAGSLLWANSLQSEALDLFMHPGGNVGLNQYEHITQISPANGDIVSTEVFTEQYVTGEGYIEDITVTPSGLAFAGWAVGTVGFGNINLAANCIYLDPDCFDWIHVIARYTHTQNISTGSEPALMLGKIDEINVTAYPNPFNDIVHIGTDESNPIGLVTVLDNFGKIILQTEISENFSQINLTDSPAGIYYVMHNTSGKVILLIKQ